MLRRLRPWLWLMIAINRCLKPPIQRLATSWKQLRRKITLTILTTTLCTSPCSREIDFIICLAVSLWDILNISRVRFWATTCTTVTSASTRIIFLTYRCHKNITIWVPRNRRLGVLSSTAVSSDFPWWMKLNRLLPKDPEAVIWYLLSVYWYFYKGMSSACTCRVYDTALVRLRGAVKPFQVPHGSWLQGSAISHHSSAPVLSALLQGQIGCSSKLHFAFFSRPLVCQAFSPQTAMLQYSLRDFLLSIFSAFEQP